MNLPKIPTTKENDSRIYLWDGGRYPSVTSIVGMLPKPALQYWAAKKVAEAAIELGVERPATEADFDWLKSAPRRDLNQAGKMGTNVHEIVEKLAADEEVYVPFEAEGFVDGFYTWRDRFSPKWVMAEETVYGEYDDCGYCGSFDAIVNIEDENWLIDYKTTRSGVHPEVALQLSAYANASHVIRPDESVVSLPDIDRLGVLWLRPDNWSFVEIGDDEAFFDVFGALLKSWHWDNGLAKTAILPSLGSGGSHQRPF